MMLSACELRILLNNIKINPIYTSLLSENWNLNFCCTQKRSSVSQPQVEKKHIKIHKIEDTTLNFVIVVLNGKNDIFTWSI